MEGGHTNTLHRGYKIKALNAFLLKDNYRTDASDRDFKK